MKNFWLELPRPFFILAPMEEVTDVVFRHVVGAAAAPDIYFTEFTNTDSYFSEKGRHSTRGRLAFSADEQPIVAQIWGSTPEHFTFMAQDLKEKGFAGIDINMGCPAKHAIKSGGGSALINTPELATEIIAAAKSAGLPVSVKTRLGYLKPDELKDWIAHILRQDIVNLTIHLRTKKEMSKVPAHYELIPEIKKLRDEIAPQTLLTINGDIRDHAHGMELVEKYGVDGVMIGRGIFTNPFAFASIDSTPLPSLPIPTELPSRSLDSGPATRATPPSLTLFDSGGVAPSTVTRASEVVMGTVGLSESPTLLSDRGLVSHSEESSDESLPAEDCLNPGAEPGVSFAGSRDETVDFSRRGALDSEGSSGGDASNHKKALINLLNLHLDLFDKYSIELEPRKFEPLKRFFKIYIRDFTGASELREKLMRTKSTNEVRQLINTSVL